MADPKDKPEDKAGQGLPSRNLHWILGAIATAAAVAIGITGVGTHQDTGNGKSAPMQTQSVAQKPSPGMLAELLKEQRQSARSAQKTPVKGQGEVGSIGSSDNSSELSSPFTPQSVQERNNMAQIAASPIVALSGNNPPSQSQVGGGQAMATAPQGSAAPQGPVTGLDEGMLKAVANEVGARNRAQSQAGAQQQWLDQNRGGSGYGPISSVLPSIPGSVLYPGTSISAVLVTRVDTQIPGIVIAQVTRNVYAANGRDVLPQGARIVGRYDSEVFDGQYRVMMAFSRVIFPDGREVTLGGSQGGGLRGTAGVPGDANTHFFKALGASLLVAFLDEGVAATGPSTTTQYPGTGANVTAPSQVGAQVLAQQAQRILEPYTSIQPTITVPAGTPFRVLVNKTIVLAPGMFATRPENGGAAR